MKITTAHLAMNVDDLLAYAFTAEDRQAHRPPASHMLGIFYAGILFGNLVVVSCVSMCIFYVTSAVSHYI